MTCDDLVTQLLAERFGPLPCALAERQPTAQRRRDLAEALAPARTRYRVPPAVLPEIGADVAAMAAKGWSAGQIAALVGVDEARVRRVMAKAVAS